MIHYWYWGIGVLMSLFKALVRANWHVGEMLKSMVSPGKNLDAYFLDTRTLSPYTVDVVRVTERENQQQVQT